MSEIDLDHEYTQYLSRFEDKLGDTAVGAFIKHEGHLVKKMAREEFSEIYTEYFDLAKTYFDSLDRGDTINDVVVKMLRQRASELILTSPV